MRMQEQQWDFQADGSGRRRLLVEGVQLSHVEPTYILYDTTGKEGLSFLSAREV
jgi:hypothetical protein